MTTVSHVLFGGAPIVATRTTNNPDFGICELTKIEAMQLLPADPIGTTSVTLTNLVSGSAIRIEEADGTLREYREADATSEVFTLDVYSAGSAKNDLVIKVRKGTAAPKYLPYTTYLTAAVGVQSVYIAQVADTIAA